MNIIECPLCETDASVDTALTRFSCDGCGITIEIAADPSPANGLDLAA